MPASSPLEPLIGAIRDLTAWMVAEGVPHAIIGGVAVCVHGEARTTNDLDAVMLLDQERWAEFVEAGARFGIEPRIPDPLGFAARSRVLLLRHRPTGVEIDVSIGGIPFEEKLVAQAQDAESQGVTFRVVRPQHLIVMKALAGRHRDLGDIESVLQLRPGLDLAETRRDVRQMALALEMPEIAERFEALLAAHRKRNRPRRKPRS